MNYMHEGGYAMWLMLVSAIAIAIYGATRPKERRHGVFVAGVLALLTQGMLGMATGMEAVAGHIAERGAEYPDKGAVVAMGLGELANNGTFAVFFAALFGIAALVTRSRTT
jgi:hypothetical protein